MAHAIVNRDATLTRLRDELDRLRRTPLTGEGGARRRERVQRSPALSLSPFPASGRIDGPTLRAARRLNRATGILATSVLLDSAVEHYRELVQQPSDDRALDRLCFDIGRRCAWHGRQTPSGTSGPTGDLCHRGGHWPAGHRVPYLERAQTSGRARMAEPVLRRTSRRPDGHPAGGSAGERGGRGAR